MWVRTKILFRFHISQFKHILMYTERKTNLHLTARVSRQKLIFISTEMHGMTLKETLKILSHIMRHNLKISVSTLTGKGLDWVRFPAGLGILLFDHMTIRSNQPSIHSSSVAPSQAVKRSDLMHLHLITMLRMRGAMPPLSHTSSWRGA